MAGLDDVTRITNGLEPSRTVLFLGAGAAVSSGAPTALELCRHLERELANGEQISDDLAELASILERRTSRKKLVEAVIARLEKLNPDGALISLAKYPWAAIYTTNYDQLLERAFRRAGNELAVVRSNYDWDAAHTPGVVPLFKIHGCISQDIALGHRASMILTLEDYDGCAEYRQLIYKRLETDFAGATAIVIGHSLQDADVQEIMRESIKLQRGQGAPGRANLLMYKIDSERADIWRGRGADNVAQGDVNSFAVELTNTVEAPAKESTTVTSAELPHSLAPCTIIVRDLTSTPHPKRLFYGATASYGDISSGLTFERDEERNLTDSDATFVIITGVSGTGKSTLARRVMSRIKDETDVELYEHRPEFPLQDSEWTNFEKSLKANGKKAVLLIDNCPQFQRELNRLARKLPEESSLRVILTAETSTWKIRQKDARFFSDCESVGLSKLTDSELGRLLNVVRNEPELGDLIEGGFLSQSTGDQLRTLKRRCKADMFVCLKALFSADSLDQIILREYAQLSAGCQDIYRLTCALEAAGALPHRQMILRLSGIELAQLGASLDVLEGLVEESETNAKLGIYSWRSRHEVIAELISKYKYSDPDELFALLDSVIETANPTYYEESRTLREMCSSNRGIRAIPAADKKLRLYRKISYVMPADRVARHRLVGELLHENLIADAEAELRKAIEDVGLDPPLQRYKIRVELARARSQGLLKEDRKAMLNNALNEAETGIRNFPDSKYLYFALADAALEWESLTGETGRVVWASQLLEEAYDRLLDPDLSEKRKELLAAQ